MTTPNDAAPHAGTWVVLPTYDEAENLEGISAAILAALPGCHLLVVDGATPLLSELDTMPSTPACFPSELGSGP